MFQLRKKLFFLLMCWPITTLAVSGDEKQIMHIIADSSTFNYKTGVTLYEGNVKIDQGSTHLTAERVTTHHNQHKIQEAVAYGDEHSLAEYTTLPKKGDTLFRAKAKVIRFYPTKSLVMLEGDVTVSQGENSFQGPFIIYNMKDQVVTAPATKTGRTTIVIEPKQLTS